MRTTLEIADDVLFAAKDMARREKKSVGNVVSELMRRAMTSYDSKLASSSPQEPTANDIDSQFQALGFHTLPARGGIVTNELINQLREREGI